GARLEYREMVPEQGVEAASFKVGEGRVELLASLGEETPVGKFLTKRGPGMHHVAYAVDDVRAAIGELSARGVELVDDEPRRGLVGEIAFDGGQIMGARLTSASADELEQALASRNDGAITLDADDGRYTIPLGRVVYMKRFTREARVGFSSGS